MAIELDTIKIVSAPGELGGRPCLAGRRITVQQVAEYHTLLHWNPDEIAEAFDLTLAEVYAALSYYYAHQAEIDRAIYESRAALDAYPSVEDIVAGRYKLLMTTAEIAEAYHISDRTVREAIDKGWIKARKSGGTWLIRRLDAERRWASKPARQ